MNESEMLITVFITDLDLIPNELKSLHTISLYLYNILFDINLSLINIECVLYSTTFTVLIPLCL